MTRFDPPIACYHQGVPVLLYAISDTGGAFIGTAGGFLWVNLSSLTPREPIG